MPLVPPVMRARLSISLFMIVRLSEEPAGAVKAAPYCHAQ
jgi:hypothetical protein